MTCRATEVEAFLRQNIRRLRKNKVFSLVPDMIFNYFVRFLAMGYEVDSSDLSKIKIENK